MVEEKAADFTGIPLWKANGVEGVFRIHLCYERAGRGMLICIKVRIEIGVTCERHRCAASPA